MIESLNKATGAYLETAEGPSAERLRFLDGLWAITYGAKTLGAAYEPPSAESAEDSLATRQPLFLLAPPTVDPDKYLELVRDVVDYVVGAEILPAEQNSSLKDTDFGPAVREQIENAGARPNQFVGDVTAELTSADGDLTEASVGFILQSALTPFLSGPAKAAIDALPDFDWHTWGVGDCPVCGAPASMAKMGESTAHKGAERTLWCSVCNSEWSYDRLRCVRCGSRAQDKLHYTHPEDDAAHRVHLCEECKGYIKVTFLSDLEQPFSFPVEEAVSADMDALARSQGYSSQPVDTDPQPEAS